MKYKIIITDSSYKDLESIKHFIAVDNEIAAKQYIVRIFNRLESLEDFPSLGSKVHNDFFNYADCLYLPCVNHIAIYHVDEVSKCVYILRVLSHFQDWRNIVNKDNILKYDVVIEDEILAISKMNSSMYYDVWKNSLDANNRKYVPDEVFETLEEASEIVKSIIKNYNTADGPFVYAIIRKRDNANIGYIQLAKIGDDWAIGYHVAEMYTNNGYATKAVSLFLTFLESNKEIKNIYGIVLANNKASIRVLEKNKFKEIFKGIGVYQGKKRKIIKTVFSR